MTRKFADLHIRWPRPGEDHLQRLLELARKMGYGHVAIEFGFESINHIRKAEEICNRLGLDLSTRLDLDPHDHGALTTMLRRYRSKFDIIAVMCRSRSMARQAAIDPGVDLLEFSRDPEERKLVNFASKEAQLAADMSCALELDFSALLTVDELGQARLLSVMRTELLIAVDKNVRVIATSGAEDFYGLRTPRDLASLMGLLGMDWQRCLEAVSTSPLQIAVGNQKTAGSSAVLGC